MAGGGISHNTADIGGGVYFHGYEDVFSMDAGFIEQNTATLRGGGVYLESGYFAMTGNAGIAYVSGNTARDGGGVYVGYSGSGGSPMFDPGGSGYITGNTATRDGGGIYIAASGYTTVSDVYIGANTAMRYGAGIFTSSRSLLSMKGSPWITEDNPIYLSSGNYINKDGPLTEPAPDTPVAVIICQYYAEGNVVLAGSVESVIEADAALFRLQDSTLWRIVYNADAGAAVLTAASP
jgi:parallel beta-helix repeat protein